jgi:hypothetical protein
VGEIIVGTSSEEVYNYIKESGPVLPTAVAERFSMNTLFASAFLSELSSKGRVLVSSIKVGGSPLYYLPEQKERLADYKDNLHDKEQRTFEMLKDRMVVEDIKLDLLDRVALRKMKDYAVALNVTVGFQTRLFWKFFTVPDDMASQVISRILQEEAIALSKQKEQMQPSMQDTVQEVVEEEKEEPAQDPIPAQPQAAPQMQQSSDAVMPQFPPQQVPTDDTIIPQQRPKEEPRSVEPEAQSTLAKETQIQRRPQPAIVPRQKAAVIQPYRIEPQDIDYYSLLETDGFGRIVANYFKQKDIVLIFTEIQKKSSEIFGIMSVPSAIGDLEYFFYAKRKKSITDKDIKEAYAESLILGYPLLYVAHGKLSKNAITFSDSKLKGCKIIELNP